MMQIINPYAKSIYIPENIINILTLLSSNSWGMNNSAQYYNPANEIPNKNIIESMGSNFYFQDFFNEGNSPDINITSAAVKKFLKNNEVGFIDNIVKDEGKYYFLSDENLVFFSKLMDKVSRIEDRYFNIIRYLQLEMVDTKNNIFTPYDLPNMQLGKKNFFDEFKHFIKIIPKTTATDDFLNLSNNVKEILLEESKVKAMTHWDLYIFQKFYMSFSADLDNLDEPYIKIYTRDIAEAASLSFVLMDKKYVDII